MKKSVAERRAQTRRWVEDHAECVQKYQREYRRKNKVRLQAAKRLQCQRVREEGLAAYGGKCTCCGEPNPKFLTLEHKNGRKKGAKRYTGTKAWYEAKRLGYPAEFTVLCFNCNCASGIYGICPHQEERNK